MKFVRSAILIGFLIGGIAFDMGVQAQTTTPSTCPVGSYKATSCTKDIITYSGGMNPGASGVRRESVPDVCEPTPKGCSDKLRLISCRTGCTQVQETTTNGQNAVTTVGQACRIMGGRKIPDRIEGECSKLGQNACRFATPKNGVGCQWVTVTDNNDGGSPETNSFCAPTWSQCKQYCFGDNKGSTNLNCFNTQNECKVERDKTVARDGQGVVFGSILLAGQSPALNFENCGELRSTNAAACMKLNSLCEPRDKSKEDCEKPGIYPGKPNDVVCQWKRTGAGAAMCFPKLEIGTGLSCGDTCLVDTDAINEQRCYPYKQTCEAQLRNGSVKYSSGPDSKLEFPVCGFADPQALAAAGILSRGTGGPTSTQRLSGFNIGDVTFKPIYADPSSGLGGVGEGLYENVGQSGSFFQKMYQVAIWFAVILAVIFMVKAGFVMATSAGNESRYSSAKGTLRNAVVGLLLAVGSFVILNTINPAILNLSILKPVTIATREAAEERLVEINTDGVGSEPYGGAYTGTFPNFKQTAAPWGSQSFGRGTVGSSGCGPSTLAIVLEYYRQKGVITIPPAYIAKYGNTINPSFTAKLVTDRRLQYSWSKFKVLAPEFGLKVKDSVTWEEALSALRQQIPVVVSMRGGKMPDGTTFTNGGHFLTLYGLDSDGKVLISDSGPRNVMKATQRDVQAAAKFYTIIYSDRVSSSSSTSVASGSFSASRAVSIAQAEIGKREGRPNNACNADLNRYYQPQSCTVNPWCAVFASWVYSQAGFTQLINNNSVNRMSAMSIRNYFNTNKGRTTEYITREQAVQGTPVLPGDMIFFSRAASEEGARQRVEVCSVGQSCIGHIGIVISYNANNKTVTTVEGNENDAVTQVTHNVQNADCSKVNSSTFTEKRCIYGFGRPK